MILASGVEIPVKRIAEICKRYGIRELAIIGLPEARVVYAT